MALIYAILLFSSFILNVHSDIARDLQNEIDDEEISEIDFFPAFDQAEEEKETESKPDIVKNLEYLPKVADFPAFEKKIPEPEGKKGF